MDIKEILQGLLDNMDDDGRAYKLVDGRYKCKLYPVYGWLWRMEINDTYHDDDLVAVISRGAKPLKRKAKRARKT